MDIQEKTTVCSQKNTCEFYKKILICAVVIFALLVVALLSSTYIMAEYRYAQANNLIEKGEYTEAYHILKECRTNKDARNLLEDFLVVNPEITTYSYNNDGEIEYIYKYKYDEFGNNVVVDEYYSDGRLNDRTEMEYNENGDMTLLVSYDEDGAVIYQREWLYDSNGNYIETVKIDKDSNVEERTTSEYDDRGNPTLVLLYVSNFTTPYRKTEYQYDEKGNMILKVQYDENGQEILKYIDEYDESGNKCLSVVYNNGKIISRTECEYDDTKNALHRTQYDENNKLISSDYLESDEQGNETLWISYNADGEIEGKTVFKYSKTSKIETEYDSDGNVLWKMVEKYNKYGDYDGYLMYDENGKIFAQDVYTYDKKGNLLQTERRGDDGEIKERTVCEYDEKGNKIRMIEYIKERITKVEEYSTPIIVYCPNNN